MKARSLLAEPGEKAGLGSSQVIAPLSGEKFAVSLHIAREHFQPLPEGVADDLAVLHVGLVRERDGVGNRPGVALPGDGAELIRDGETLFVRGDDGGEELAGELLQIGRASCRERVCLAV